MYHTACGFPTPLWANLQFSVKANIVYSRNIMCISLSEYLQSKGTMGNIIYTVIFAVIKCLWNPNVRGKSVLCGVIKSPHKICTPIIDMQWLQKKEPVETDCNPLLKCVSWTTPFKKFFSIVRELWKLRIFISP